MAKTPKRRLSTGRVAKVAAPFLLVALVGALVVSAAAARPAEVIVLPGATSAEGASPPVAGRPFTPAICSPATSSAATSSTAQPNCSSTPPPVARLSAWSPIWRTSCSSSPVASPAKGMSTTPAPVQPWRPISSPHPRRVVNDVALTKDGAWFTDSVQAKLYFVPVSAAGVPGPFRTLALSGPAADTSGEFNLNGIQATSTARPSSSRTRRTASSIRSILSPAPARRSPG